MSIQHKKLIPALIVGITMGAGSAFGHQVQAATSNSTPAAKPQRTATITGRIVDENGQPIPGFGLGVRAVISNADFQRLITSRWTQGPKGEQMFVYEGPPLADVVGRDEHGRSMIDVSATARTNGTYTLTGLMAGHYYLMDVGNLNPDKVISPVSVDAHEGETVQAPDIVVSNGQLLRGQIVDKETGAPLPGLVLRYFDAAHPFESEWGFSPRRNGRRNLVTDADGRFELRLASGDATFFIAGLGRTFIPSDLALTERQHAEFQASISKNVFREVLGVKSGQNFYASDMWVEVSEDGGPLRQLARAQWTRTRVESNRDKTLLFRLQKLNFKDGKPPRVPVLGTVYEGDPRG